MEQELPAFRKTIAVSIEGRSYEEARTNLEEQWVDGIVRSMGVSLLIEEIWNIEDHPRRLAIPLVTFRSTRRGSSSRRSRTRADRRMQRSPNSSAV